MATNSTSNLPSRLESIGGFVKTGSWLCACCTWHHDVPVTVRARRSTERMFLFIVTSCSSLHAKSSWGSFAAGSRPCPRQIVRRSGTCLRIITVIGFRRLMVQPPPLPEPLKAQLRPPTMTARVRARCQAEFSQQLEPLGRKLGHHERHACDIFGRLGEAVDETSPLTDSNQLRTGRTTGTYSLV